MKGTRYFLSVTLCALIGATVSGLALQHHFRRDSSTFCNLNATFDCDVVNRSAYSTFGGIPVALIGLAAYILIAGLAMLQKDKPETPPLLLLLGLAGSGISVYLTYVEAVVLRTWCLLCLTSLLMVFWITVFSAIRVRADLRGSRGAN